MTAFLHGLLLIVAVAAGSAIAVRWIAPTVLRIVGELLGRAVDVLGAAALWPEYLVSTTWRARGDDPPRLAYDYGDLVAGSAGVVRHILHRLCRDLARAAESVPPALVGGLAAVIQLLALLT